MSVVQKLERILSPYESMCWPMQALFPIVTGPDVIQAITGWKPRPPREGNDASLSIPPRLFVLAAEMDVLCTPQVLSDAAIRYRTAFHDCLGLGKLDGVSDDDRSRGDSKSEQWNGVKFETVEGVAHHQQNHVEWESGAGTVLRWLADIQ